MGLPGKGQVYVLFVVPAKPYIGVVYNAKPQD
jgi:hypothetical protein